MELKELTLYTDGAAKGNPDGPGGYGAILTYTHTDGTVYEQEFSGGVPKTTNNRMEMMAVIVGLESIIKKSAVTVVSDSKYVTDAFNQRWIAGWQRNGWRNSKGEEVKNIDLWHRLLAVTSKHEVKFQWVKGHNLHKYNERCDRLASAAAEAARHVPMNFGI